MKAFRDFFAIKSEIKVPDFIKSGNFEKDFSDFPYLYGVVYYTDEVLVIDFSEKDFVSFKKELDVSKLLELRLFNKEKEYFLLRKEDGFLGRIRTDLEGEKEPNCEVFDELHKVWNRCKPLKLSEQDDVFVRVRNYFNSDGLLTSLDWRFVDFQKLELKKDEGR